MPKLEEFEKVMEEFAPRELAESWDNVGSLVDCGGDITSVLVSLDITEEVVMEAEAQGCQLIIAHHPVIFSPLTRIHYTDVVYRMIKKSISCICAHTNLDAAASGVSDVLAAIMGLTDVSVFAGGGRIGRLKTSVTAGQIAEACASRFGTSVKLADSGRAVNRLAVLGGSGGGYLKEAIAAGADCYLTGEADHHDAIDARQAGVSLVVAGHYSTEFPVVPVLADRLSKRFPGVRVMVSRRNKDPFTYL